MPTPDRYFDRKPNRTTTLDSLSGVVGLLLADTEEQFVYYYGIATHDKNAGTYAWNMCERTYAKKAYGKNK